MLTGDVHQLLNFVEDLPFCARPAAFTSALKHALELPSEMASLARLVYSHRSHPEIIRCLAAAVYGDGIAPGASADEKGMLVNCQTLALPERTSPIVLLHQPEFDVKDTQSTSRYNPSQADKAAVIFCKLSKALLDASIVCLCLYIGELVNLKELLRVQLPQNNNVKVSTVDGYQSQEGDIVYLLTTRSTKDGVQAGSWSSSDLLKFTRIRVESL
jgi:hypothetical protein